MKKKFVYIVIMINVVVHLMLNEEKQVHYFNKIQITADVYCQGLW